MLEEKFANQEQMISDLKVQLDAAKHGWRPMTEESWARPLLALQWSKKMNGKDTELLSLLRQLADHNVLVHLSAPGGGSYTTTLRTNRGRIVASFSATAPPYECPMMCAP